MASRLELQTKLEELVGSKNVYYQPPESVKIKYPAIVYSKSRIDTRSADDMSYISTKCYELTVIDKRPDNEVINKLLAMPMCSFSTHFISDNLHHDVLTLYY